ncbi:MAG: FAD-dependent oxidoreductase [Kineosporiaceae bacterium]|nr:FAD-dependent oxidoreductase [Kineosporiaceae bacterium]
MAELVSRPPSAPARPMPRRVAPSAACLTRARTLKVAVVGGGMGGLAAARQLASWGASVTVYEARTQVGGRVLSDSRFAKGRVIEFGAELVGSIHTRWCALAVEYGISLISRMDGDLYEAAQLDERVILDRLLTPDEADAVQKRLDAVLKRIAEFARDTIPAGFESHPWDLPRLRALDLKSVAEVLEKDFGIARTDRLWLALELFLVNNNVARLEQMSYLALLCLVRGGQTSTRPDGRRATIAEDSLLGYWEELEIYRCADGCQRLALAMAAEVHARKGCRVVRKLGVRRIDLPRSGGGVMVTAYPVPSNGFDRWLREKIPGNPLMDTRRYDYVVLAVPPTVWGDIEIVPFHPKDVIGQLGWGPAVKFFSRLSRRFWVEQGWAPLGGSLDIGQVWEGTDNQAQTGKQPIVLNVFTGARTPTKSQYTDGLARLYPAVTGRPRSGYRANLLAAEVVDWSRQPFIRTGYSSPRVGQVFTIGKELNEPFGGRLFFAGEHTQLDHFGYMEGAIRSGERAARQLLEQACRSLEPNSQPRVASRIA